jgi:hypothetical protein
VPQPGNLGIGARDGTVAGHPRHRSLVRALPDQSQYNRRLRRLTGWITTTQPGVAELIVCGRVRLVDGTLLGLRQLRGLRGEASYGYCPSKSRFYWGMRLVLMSDRTGVPVDHDLRPAGEREHDASSALATAHRGATLVADEGLWGRQFLARVGQGGLSRADRDGTFSGLVPAARVFSVSVTGGTRAFDRFGAGHIEVRTNPSFTRSIDTITLKS